MQITASHAKVLNDITLVTGGTGKTGSRIVQKLRAMGVTTRVASRSGSPAFGWNDPDSWNSALDGVGAVYIGYAPDLAVPKAFGIIRDFVARAVEQGVQRLVLLSGRGEPEAVACEGLVQASGVDWTIVRAAWFNQNFSEGEFLGLVREGNLALPAGMVPEPFVDADDIADVAVAALTEQGHSGEVYELTGPRLLTFTEVAEELSDALGRDIQFTPIPHRDFMQALAGSGMPGELAGLLDYLFGTVLDGRNAWLGDGVQRALGREAKDFSLFAEQSASRGIWLPVQSSEVA